MKKRIILFLVSIFSVILCIFSLTGCTGNNGNQDADKANFVQGTTPYETLKTFVTEYPDRTSTQTFGADKAKDAALWIAEQFKSFGYTSEYADGITAFNYDNAHTSSKQIGYNVVYTKKGSSDKTVVVGAHYDNVYGLNSTEGAKMCSDGSYNNGVGVATLIELARVLKDEQLPFNVEFVAFGAKEFGYCGSKYYLSHHKSKQSIMLMINFDRNALGDFVYMYSSEAKTKHNDLFYKVAKENNLCISDLPSYKAPSMVDILSADLYKHEANKTDSEVFLSEGINIVNFISMNFSPKGVVESAGKDQINYTDNDNLVKIVKMYGGEEQTKAIIDKQINSAISAVVYAFREANFVEVMTSSKANNGLDIFADTSIMSYIAYGIVGGSIIACVIVYFVLRKKVKPHDVYVNTVYGRVNMNTGKIEGVDITQFKPGENMGNVFGKEFEGNSEKFDVNSKMDNDSEKEKKDKTNDIFGDF